MRDPRYTHDDTPHRVNHIAATLLEVCLKVWHYRRPLIKLWRILTHPPIHEWVAAALDWVTAFLGLG